LEKVDGLVLLSRLGLREGCRHGKSKD